MNNSGQAMESLATRRCWLFDMDGTLTNAMHDFDAMREALSLPRGVPILEALDAMPPADARRKRRELDEMELEMAGAATAQPGCSMLLDRLLARGASLGIVTRNGRDIADATLAACGLSHYFPAQTIVSRDCAIPKPDPAGVQLALQRLDAQPAEAVMVGDYEFDLAAGRQAGAVTVHLDTSERYDWPELTDIGVASLAALSDLIGSDR